MTKAIVMFSGGLDSVLTAKVLMNEGIDVLGLTFITEFSAIDVPKFTEKIKKRAEAISLKLRIIDISQEFLGLLKDPFYGFGANINPCVDCKIYMLKRAKEIMEKEGYSFIATGEVVGERPMSQRRDTLYVIEKKAGLKGYLLRPLSAKLLNPTVPEETGLINREHLYAISGRSRKPQMELAEKFGISEYAQPAGGCLLTEPAFSSRLKDIIKHDMLNIDNIKLLKFGRHFRLDAKTRFVLGRDEKDNENVLSSAEKNDVILSPKDFNG
ncbi:MAG: tRNA 4-thiouridine(8) synthase ThiI [Candidatus Omnitrophica bacterium]|nr:tRNA 4-thiouridine(8) synthase ThiI [Candidatus Omnitrophota bacterium]